MSYVIDSHVILLKAWFSTQNHIASTALHAESFIAFSRATMVAAFESWNLPWHMDSYLRQTNLNRNTRRYINVFSSVGRIRVPPVFPRAAACMPLP